MSHDDVPVDGVRAKTAVVAIVAGLRRPQRERVRVVRELAQLAQGAELPRVAQLPRMRHLARVRHLTRVCAFMRRTHYLSVDAGAHCRSRGHSHFHACQQTENKN